MASNPSRTPDASAIVDALFTLMPKVIDHLNDRLEAFDLTNNDLWALRTIDGPTPMKELARRMDFDPSYVTVMADRLESRGLIERQPHPTDRRVKNLVITPKGEETRATLISEVWSGDTMFSALSKPERAQFLELVQKVAGSGES